MDVWGWLIGYVVLFALLHLVLYYVYVRRSKDDRAGPPSFAEGPGPRSSPGQERYPGREEVGDPREFEDSLDFDGETIRCPYCGARNESDPVFTNCWNCISTLRQ